MKTKQPFLSIIVPVYNEEKRMKKGVEKIFRFIDEQKFTVECIIVNDGSTDITLQMLQALKHPSLKIISYERNRGKGYAVRKGIKSAKGEYRLFLDIDMSTPIEEFHKFLPFLKRYDVVIGSRRVRESKILVHQPFLRERMGAVFTFLSATILSVAVSDFTCGFKCFSKKASQIVFSLGSLDGWGFDSEIIFLSQKKGFAIKEVPVVWKNDTQTRVVLLKDVFLSFWDLLTIRINELSGKYDG